MNICEEIVAEIKAHLVEILHLRDRFSKKDDGSYVSDGDKLVQSIVFEYVKAHLPGYELISEELAPFDNHIWRDSASYVVLDPIDGTENFISGLKEWGVGISIYAVGKHHQSCIYLPELDEVQITGMPLRKYRSRIYGLSSSLNKHNLLALPDGFEYRIIGCSMYNLLSAVRGSFAVFENVNGANCWDILPGLNLALEHGCKVAIDGQPYAGQILFPLRKYKIRISNLEV
jgi:myo-inositol-1(or 4)-monophosphatase